MDPRVAPLAEILRLNTRLFRNCLAGLADPKARERPSDATNCGAFLAAHLVDSRYYTLGLLGGKESSPLKGAKGGFNDISQVTAYPSLAEIQAAWTGVAETLDRRLQTLTAAELDAPLDPGFPVDNKTLLGVFIFMVQHDCYHLGQLGFVRKFTGLPAMAYD
ncbi:MAG TPA: DinB family protein [Gemmatimonadales bacterium]